MLYGVPTSERRSGSSHLTHPMVYNASVLSLNQLATHPVPSSALICGLTSPRLSNFDSSVRPTTSFMKMDRFGHPNFQGAARSSHGLANHLQRSDIDNSTSMSLSPAQIKRHDQLPPSTNRILGCHLTHSVLGIPTPATSAIPSLTATTSGAYSQLTLNREQSGYLVNHHVIPGSSNVLRTDLTGFSNAESIPGSGNVSTFTPTVLSDEFMDRTQAQLGLAGFCKSPSAVRFACNLGSKERRPCDICGDVSAGFHCNAYVCEACKKFFIRSSKSDNHAKYTCTKSSMCEINKDTRTHCQRCRYEKCLHLGMVLPGAATLPATDISEIPCRVCGAKSSGFHFGAITCEGCKGFFRRTINERENQRYTCRNGGSCAVTGATRNNCKSCRYRRCLAVGMSKDGSRIGRQPNAVKHRCAMEIEQLRSAVPLATGCLKSPGTMYFSTPTCSIVQAIHSPLSTNIATSVVDDSASICDTYLSGDSMVQSPQHQHQHRNLHQHASSAQQYQTHSNYTPTELLHADQASAMNVRLSALPSAFSPHFFGTNTGGQGEHAMGMLQGRMDSHGHLVTMPYCGSVSSCDKPTGSSLSMVASLETTTHQYAYLPTAYKSTMIQMSEEFQKPRSCQFPPRQYLSFSSGQAVRERGKEQQSPHSPGVKFFTATAAVGNKLDRKVEFMEVDNSLQSAVQYGQDRRSFETVAQGDEACERNSDQVIASQPIGLLHLSQAAQIYSQRERQRNDEGKQNTRCVGHSSLRDSQISLYEGEQFTCGVTSKACSTPNTDLGSTMNDQPGDSESQLTYASNDGNADNRWQCGGATGSGFIPSSTSWELSGQLEQHQQKVQNYFPRPSQQRGGDIVLSQTGSSTGHGQRPLLAMALPASPAMQASPSSRADTDERYCATNPQHCNDNTSGCLQNMRMDKEANCERFSDVVAMGSPGIGVEEQQSNRTKVRRKSFTIDEPECIHTVCGDRRSVASGGIDNSSDDLEHGLCPCLIPNCQSARAQETNHQDGLFRQQTSVKSVVQANQVYTQSVSQDVTLSISGAPLTDGTIRSAHFSAQPCASYAPPHKTFLSRFNADSLNKQHEETSIFEPDRQIVPPNVYCEVTRESVHQKLSSTAKRSDLEGLSWTCRKTMIPSGDDDQSNKGVEMDFNQLTSGCDVKVDVDNEHGRSGGYGTRPLDWSTARTVGTGTAFLPVQQQFTGNGEAYAQYVTLADRLQQRFLNFCSSPPTSNNHFSTATGYSENPPHCTTSVPTLHTILRGRGVIMDHLPHQIPVVPGNGEAPGSDSAPESCQTCLPPMVDLVKLRHLATGQGYPSTLSQSSASVPLESDIQVSLFNAAASGGAERPEHLYRLLEKPDCEGELLPSWLGHNQRVSDRQAASRCSTSLQTTCTTSSPTRKSVYTAGANTSNHNQSSCSCDLGAYREVCLHCRLEVPSSDNLTVPGNEQSSEATPSLGPWFIDRTSLEGVGKKICCSTSGASENEDQASGTNFSTCSIGQMRMTEDNLELFTSEVVEAAHHLQQCRHRPLASIYNDEKDISEMLWCYMMKHFGTHVYRFSSALPVLRDLPHPILKTLVRESLYSIVLVQLSLAYNSSTKEYSFFNIIPSEKEIILQDFPELQTCENHLSEIGSLVNSLSLVEVETALLCCLILLYSGEQVYTRSSKLQIVYDFAVAALKHCIQDLSAEKSRLHDILSVIPRLHAMNRENRLILEYLKRERNNLCFPNLSTQISQLADLDAISGQSGV